MTEIDELRKSRSYTKGKLTRIRTQVLQAANATDGGFDKEQAEARLEKLEQVCSEFEAIQMRLLEKLGELTVDDTTEDEQFEERYFEVKALLKKQVSKSMSADASATPSEFAIAQILQQQTELIQHIGRGISNDASTPATTSESNGNETLAAILDRQTEILDRVASTAATGNADNRIKLPTIKLSRFDGKIEEWKCFSDSFRSIIHGKQQLSDIEKFQYLISAISGDAAKIIESIELTGQNYITAWELLQQRYDDPRSLKKKHIQCLFTMPTVVKESAKAIRDLIDYTSRHMRVLKVLGLPVEAWDELIMHMIEAKLDVRTLRAWEEEGETSEGNKLQDMLDFLKKKCRTLERIESRSVDKNEKQVKDSDQRGKGSAISTKTLHG